MKVELKKFKFHPDMTDETNCFSAEVYIDGVRAMHASNSGTGGCNELHDIVRGSFERLRAYCKTLPPVNCAGPGEPASMLDMDVDLFIGQLVESLIMEKELKRHRTKLAKDLKTKIMFTRNDGKPGIWQIKLGPGQSWEKLKAHPTALSKFRETKPYVDVILNDIPEEQAWEIQKKELCPKPS